MLHVFFNSPCGVLGFLQLLRAEALGETSMPEGAYLTVTANLAPAFLRMIRNG